MTDENRSDEFVVAVSSGNVFADLELPDAEEALAKADLAIAINRIMEARGLTERQTAAILDTSPIPRSQCATWTLHQGLHRLAHAGSPRT